MRYAMAGCCVAASMLVGCGGATDGVTTSQKNTSSHVAPYTFVASDYHLIVQQLYIAYFGRPADPSGLSNFASELSRLDAPTGIQALNAAYGSNPEVRALVDSFGTSPESRALYSGDTQSFVTAIYRNVLNRAPDPDGLRFWVNAIDQRVLTQANASFSIMAGALANQTPQGQADARLITQRVLAGSRFTSALSTPALVNAYNGNNAAAIARDMLNSVTASTNDEGIQAAINLTLPVLTDAATPPAAGNLPAPVPTGIPMSMSCVDGPMFQCSGNTILRVENGVGLTSSGVQVYGRSTSDLAIPNPNKTTAFGLAPAQGGVADVRVAKTETGTVPAVSLLLHNLGLTWDGRTERPQIIETFRTSQGRTLLGANGALASAPLPASSDLNFFNVATLGSAGTQANYANNSYFPRAEPSRCDTGVSACPTTETAGIRSSVGDWRLGGITPDSTSALRLHEDGDVHAGDGVAGGTGVGVPFPGSKGYRQISNWGYQYANISSWLTQDTVQIAEWNAPEEEHNKNRRGVVAFGAVTDPAAVPTSGSASYSGIVYGWQGTNAVVDPSVFYGNATITVNFATRQVSLAFRNVVTYDAAATPISIPSFATAAAGAAGTNVSNYFTARLATSAFNGGLSGRFFGPVVASGTSGSGPAEIAGTLTLTGTNGATTTIGGFIGRKQ